VKKLEKLALFYFSIAFSHTFGNTAMFFYKSGYGSGRVNSSGSFFYYF